MQADVDPVHAALSHDTMRGLKKKNYWVMEHQSGGGGWDCVAVTPKPGELRLWTYQSIAHGADGIVYFRWRTCRTGTEQYWQGILEHHGIPGRRYDEVSQVGDELKRLGDLVSGSIKKSGIAIMQSYDSRFAFQIQPNHPGFNYEKQLLEIYRGFFDQNISVEIVSEKDPLVGFKVVIVPSLYILSDVTCENLEKFAEAGGIVVFLPRTGVKDVNNTFVNKKLPGLVAKMCGIEIEELVSMADKQSNQVQFCLAGFNEKFDVSLLADVIEPKGAKVIANYLDDFYSDKPAATLNSYGYGKVIYLGMMGERDFYTAIAQWVSGLADITVPLETPIGVEVVTRWQGEKRLLFILNHQAEDQQISIGYECHDLLSGKDLSGNVFIPSCDILILIEKN